MSGPNDLDPQQAQLTTDDSASVSLDVGFSSIPVTPGQQPEVVQPVPVTIPTSPQ